MKGQGKTLERLELLIKGRAVESVAQHRPGELVLFLSGGVRLFVDAKPDGTLELSVTGDVGQETD